jgi:hypothetical protein
LNPVARTFSKRLPPIAITTAQGVRHFQLGIMHQE